MKNENIEYIAINHDDTGEIDEIIGKYPTLAEAKSQAEAYIKESVMFGYSGNNPPKSYNELRKLGAVPTSKWYYVAVNEKNPSEASYGITYKFHPDSTEETIILWPAKDFTYKNYIHGNDHIVNEPVILHNDCWEIQK